MMYDRTVKEREEGRKKGEEKRGGEERNLGACLNSIDTCISVEQESAH